MQTIRGVVRDGKLIVNEPVALPEGMELTLVVSEPERAAIDQAWADAQISQIIPVERMLERMHRDRQS